MAKPNYRSLVPGGYFSSDWSNKSVPVSIRYNNPGAINGDPAWVKAWPGFVGTTETTKGNPTALFETPEQGVACWYELMRKYASGGHDTVHKIIVRYGGSAQTESYKRYAAKISEWTGLDEDHHVQLEGDDEVLLSFAKAMFRYEAGREIPWSDEQLLYGFNLARGAVRAPTPPSVPVPSPAPTPGYSIFDSIKAIVQALVGLFGKNKNLVVSTPGADLASRLVQCMERKGYHLERTPDHVNIVYVEGMGPNGAKNNDRANEFNDTRFVIVFEGGKPKIAGAWEATTEPGRYYTENPINSAGTARIAFGQYRKVWVVGMHNGNHEGLLQRGGPVSVHRDLNKDYVRTGDRVDTGMFGINQHHAYGDRPYADVGPASAGCLVGRFVGEHQTFMRIVKSDPRYLQSNSFAFDTTILSADDL